MPTEQEFAVSEIFFSLQGESTYAGLPCVFIRLSGCNLRCRYCDASYTYDETARVTPLSAILDHVDRYPGAMVEVTGGEPLLQPNTIVLLQALQDRGRTVLLETNGSLDLSPVPAGVVTIMDVKCPGSGMKGSIRIDNLTLLRPGDEVKFVLTSRNDYEWAKSFISEQRLIDPQNGRAHHPLLMSPVPGTIPPAELAAWILHDNLPFRLQLQLHKILWSESKRGV